MCPGNIIVTIFEIETGGRRHVRRATNDWTDGLLFTLINGVYSIRRGRAAVVCPIIVTFGVSSLYVFIVPVAMQPFTVLRRGERGRERMGCGSNLGLAMAKDGMMRLEILPNLTDPTKSHFEEIFKWVAHGRCRSRRV